VRGRPLGLAASAVALALAVGWFLLKTRQLAGFPGVAAFPLDDSWIHMQFARNLAEGRGFTFAVFGSQPALAKALGLAAALVTAWLAGHLAEVWTGSRELGLLASLLTALAGPMVWGALSGMEVSLAALLVCASLLLDARGSPWRAAGALGLAVITRPEAVLLLPLFWLAGPLTWRRSVTWLAPVVACLAPWVAFNLATTRTPLPATATAKIEGGLVGLLAGVREPVGTMLFTRPWQFAWEWTRWLWQVDALVPILLLPGLWWLGRRWGRAALAPACVLLVHPLAMALLAPYRGPAFQEGRYSIHLLPLAIVVAVTPLSTLSPDGVRGIRRVRGVGGYAQVAVGLALLAGVLVALPPAASRYGWGVQNIEAMQVHLGRWVERHTPPTARLALNDVGAITYFSRREIVDVMGLVTPAIIPFRREGEAGVLRYLERTCPDYLIVFPAWFPTISAMTDHFEPVYRVRLPHNTVAGADELVVYEAHWSRWRADRRPCPGARARTPPALGEAPGKIGQDRIIVVWRP